jgi:hypothetical protein
MGLVAEPVLWLPDAVGLVPRWTVRVHPPFDAVTGSVLLMDSKGPSSV